MSGCPNETRHSAYCWSTGPFCHQTEVEYEAEVASFNYSLSPGLLRVMSPDSICFFFFETSRLLN